MRRGSAASVCRRPARPDGLVDGKSPGAPSKLNGRSPPRKVVEAGPVPAVDGVVRWRRKDLARWLLETFSHLARRDHGRANELKLRQDLGAAAPLRAKRAGLFYPRRTSGRGSRKASDELWWQDEPASARRISHADGSRRGTRPRAPRDQRNGPISSARSVPRRGKAPGWSCPGATPTPWRRTSSR